MLDCLCGIMLAEAMQLFDCQFIWIIFAWQNIFNTWFNAYLLGQLGQTPLPHNLVFAVHLHLHHEHLNLIFNLSCQVKSSKIPILKSSATFFFFLNTYSNSYSIPDWSVPLNIKDEWTQQVLHIYTFYLSRRWDNEYLYYFILYAVGFFFNWASCSINIKCYYILTISSFFLYASNSARPAFLLASLCSAIPEQAIIEGESDTGWKWKLSLSWHN